MNGKVTYRQQFTRCGKQRCRKCREGLGHGPYWYAYWSEKGRTVSKYIGIHLPEHLVTAQQMPKDTAKKLAQSTTVQNLPSPVLRIYLLGQFRIERKDGHEWITIDSRTWQRRRARALLGCLLSSPGRRLAREQIMELLWPDLDSELAANRLNGAVHELRQILEPGIVRPAASCMLRLERDILELANSTQIWVDAEAFEQLIKEANTATDPQKIASSLEEAIALYKGNYLLEELYSEWAALRRDNLQRAWIGLLLDLAHLRAEQGAYTSAIETLDRLRTADPTNETALQRLMILLTQLDRRGEALQVYRQHITLLQRDYASEPLAETTELYEALRKGHVPTMHAHKEAIVHKKDSLSIPLSTPPEPLQQQITFSRPLFQAGRHSQSPLLGCHDELEVLRQVLLAIEEIPLLSPARTKQPHVILLQGETGIGKTRLAEEISFEAYTRGWAVAWSRSYEQEGSIPYRSWIELLRTLLQGTTAFPNFVETIVASNEANASSSLLHERERLHLWEATLGLLGVLSKVHPLLLVFDDLHWIDNSSIELLTYLTHHLQGQHILLVATYREGELPPRHKLRMLIADLCREQTVVTLVVQPLTQAQIGMLVSHLSPEAVLHIQTQAAGNPFFAEELARSHPSLSEAIAAVLERRLSKLSSSCQALLGKAAVLGDSFEPGQLLAMANEHNEDTILDLLEEALHAGLLTEEGTGAHITYHFWHPLMINYLYERLSATRRTQLHRKVAEGYQRMYP